MDQEVARASKICEELLSLFNEVCIGGDIVQRLVALKEKAVQCLRDKSVLSSQLEKLQAERAVDNKRYDDIEQKIVNCLANEERMSK